MCAECSPICRARSANKSFASLFKGCGVQGQSPWTRSLAPKERRSADLTGDVRPRTLRSSPYDCKAKKRQLRAPLPPRGRQTASPQNIQRPRKLPPHNRMRGEICRGSAADPVPRSLGRRRQANAPAGSKTRRGAVSLSWCGPDSVTPGPSRQSSRRRGPPPAGAAPAAESPRRRCAWRSRSSPASHSGSWAGRKGPPQRPRSRPGSSTG